MPSTFTSASKSGRSTETRTSAWAARWKTASGRTASKTASGSRMSATWSSAPAGDPLALPLREVVEDVHLVAAREQRVDDVRADEAGPPGDDRPHAPRILGSVGLLLAIEGIDGSGKGTQAARLAETARARRLQRRVVQLPALRRQPVQPRDRPTT